MTDPVPDRGALSLGTRTGLPEALRVLSEDFPREGWEKHPGLDGMVKFWLDRHIAFRRLTALMRDDTMALIGGDMEHGTFAPRLTRMGNHFLSDLHAHHSIEDAYFFPRLVDLDSRISHVFGLLEADHEEIDVPCTNSRAARAWCWRAARAAPLPSSWRWSTASSTVI